MLSGGFFLTVWWFPSCRVHSYPKLSNSTFRKEFFQPFFSQSKLRLQYWSDKKLSKRWRNFTSQYCIYIYMLHRGGTIPLGGAVDTQHENIYIYILEFHNVLTTCAIDCSTLEPCGTHVTPDISGFFFLNWTLRKSSRGTKQRKTLNTLKT